MTIQVERRSTRSTITNLLWTGLGLVGVGILMRAVRAEKRATLSRAKAGSSRIDIACPVPTVYEFVRRPENAQEYMQPVDEVERKDAQHARWVLRARGGMRVTWDGELVEDQPLKRLVWEWRTDDALTRTVTFQFVPVAEGRATTVELALRNAPISGPLATVFAELLADPGAQADMSLRRLKRLLETADKAPLDPVAERTGIVREGRAGSNV